MQSLKILPGLSLVIDMRLIDADKFKDNIMSGLYIFCQENKEDIARAIDDEPTVELSLKDPTGEWICDYRYLDCKCSICNSYALERGDYPELSPYCPQCGARMNSIRFKDGGSE